ncbi:MAG: hypothetical protein PHC64_01955 [Candidatus Gastranaerophilales bacterium]|nr:hypothetical protein [Candidatus Gastranaerophilales bacterium]
MFLSVGSVGYSVQCPQKNKQQYNNLSHYSFQSQPSFGNKPMGVFDMCALITHILIQIIPIYKGLTSTDLEDFGHACFDKLYIDAVEAQVRCALYSLVREANIPQEEFSAFSKRTTPYSIVMPIIRAIFKNRMIQHN